MFTFIVVRGWAHRLLENGTVESSRAWFDKDKTPKSALTSVNIENDWQPRVPETMGLDGWDYDQIRAELDTIRTKIPNNYSVPPQPIKEVQVDKIAQPV